ncbi:MAG: hypothetical protein WCK49_01335 [Myxococcaceae bacterium]
MRFCTCLLILIQSSFAFSNMIFCQAQLPAEHGSSVLDVSIFDESKTYRISVSNDGYQEVLPILHIEETGIGFIERIANCIGAGVFEKSCIETYFGKGTKDRDQVILEAIEIHQKHNFGIDMLQVAKARKYFATPKDSSNPAGLTEYYDLRGNLMGRIFSPGSSVLVACTSKELKDVFSVIR